MFIYNMSNFFVKRCFSFVQIIGYGTIAEKKMVRWKLKKANVYALFVFHLSPFIRCVFKSIDVNDMQIHIHETSWCIPSFKIISAS